MKHISVQRALPILLLLAFAFCTPIFVTTVLPAKSIDEQSLRDIEDKVQAVVKRVMPATVGVGTAGGMAGGSGVVVSKDGLILTAAHVVAATGEDVVIYFPDGRRAKAVKLGADNDADAAMLQLQDKGNFPYVDFGDSEQLKENDWLIAIGHAGGFQSDRTPPVRLGRLLKKNRDGFLATDCTLIGGDSGGPLFDIHGKVVGIHSNIGNALTSNNHVPLKVFLDSWQKMKDGETWGNRFGPSERLDPKAAVLGIMPMDGDEGNESIRVRVLPGSPADKAGMETGDKLLKIGNRRLDSYAAVRKIMTKKKPGDEIKLVVERDGEEKELVAKLLSREDVSDNMRRARNRSRRERAENAAEARPPTDEELNALLRAHIDRAKENDWELELDPGQIRELGGRRSILQRLRKLVEPEEFAKLIGEETSKDDPHLESITAAFADIVDDAAVSVVPIFDGDRQVALGTAIREDGYLLTKASEIDEGELIANVDELTRAKLKIVREFPKYDLAIVHIDADLVPVRWYAPDPALGSLVAAAGTSNRPLAVGVVSVSERNLSGSDQGYLGVMLDERWVRPGVRVLSVQQESPAAAAGLKDGDVLTELNGEKMSDIGEFIEAVKGKTPGHAIQLGYERNGEGMTAEVKLSSRADIISMRQDGTDRYPTGGKLSDQRSGYPNAFQTDLPIRPQDCGSPIVDLEGRVLGINVARAGRIKSYAIPAETIKELLDDVEFE